MSDGLVGAGGGEHIEKLYKVLVIGEIGTGKTSIIKRYVHNFFSQHYRATIGVDFALKVLSWDQNTVVRLQLWDIAGQERFGSMTRVYYKEAVGALIVFDVTRANTFDAVSKWKADLDAKVVLLDQRPVPAVLIANKCDMPEREGIAATPSQLDEYCANNGFAAWYECSAKDNLNIEEAHRGLIAEIMRREQVIQQAQARESGGVSGQIAPGRNPDAVALERQSRTPPKSSSGRCCG